MSATNDDLWAEAMALLLEWQARPEDARAREKIRGFCALSAAHAGAWDEARRVFRLTGQAVGVSEPPAPAHAMSRRRTLLAGAGLIFAAGAALKGPELVRRWRSDVVTEKGAMERIDLWDGSWLTLGPDSAVALAIGPTSRRVTLIEGMVMCDIGRSTGPMFEVETAGLSATALEARFDVSRNGSNSQAGVEGGSIRIALDARPADEITLAAGDWFALETSSGQSRRGHRNPNQMAVWRQGLIIADQQDIASVVAQIARWHPGRVVIADPGLAAAPVSGLFDLGAPDAALAAVVEPYGGKVRHISPWLTVLTRI